MSRSFGKRPLIATDRDLDTLADLGRASGPDRVFVKAKALGASAGSHHSKTLHKLVALRWVEMDRTPGAASNSRATIRWRPTDFGLTRIAKLQEKQKEPRHAITAQ